MIKVPKFGINVPADDRKMDRILRDSKDLARARASPLASRTNPADPCIIRSSLETLNTLPGESGGGGGGGGGGGESTARTREVREEDQGEGGGDRLASEERA
jgi:hypothetical protein